MTSQPARYLPDAMPNPAASPETKPFWDAALEHRLVLQRCASCRRFRHPPRALCPWCRSFESGWEDVAGRGTLFTVSLPQAPFPAPQRQPNPPADMAMLRARQVQELESAHWIDRDRRVVHLGAEALAGRSVLRFPRSNRSPKYV